MYGNVGNLHVSAVVSENVITPLYSVREGECDKSYGIHCAKMVGFPEDVIQVLFLVTLNNYFFIRIYQKRMSLYLSIPNFITLHVREK